MRIEFSDASTRRPIPRSRSASSGACSSSVTTNAQSAWRMSRRSSSPRRVGFRPTSTLPLSAAPPRRNRYSGTLSSSTAKCGIVPVRRVVQGVGADAHLGDGFSPGPRPVFEPQRPTVVAGPGGEHCRECVSVRTHGRAQATRSGRSDSWRSALVRRASRTRRRSPRSPTLGRLVNETLLVEAVDAAGCEDLVLRLPPLIAAFPDDDRAFEAQVLTLRRARRARTRRWWESSATSSGSARRSS